MPPSDHTQYRHVDHSFRLLLVLEQARVYTWVKFGCKYLHEVDQFWTQINTLRLLRAPPGHLWYALLLIGYQLVKESVPFLEGAVRWRIESPMPRNTGFQEAAKCSKTSST